MKEYESKLKEYESLIGREDEASIDRRKEIVDWLAASDDDEVKASSYAMLMSRRSDIDTFNAICKDMGDKLYDVVNTKIRRKIKDIELAISWREIANTYFHKDSSWIYDRLNGIDHKGNFRVFTQEERGQLKGALIDLSNRIRAAADKIQ